MHAIREELLELRLDGVCDAAQAADGLALSGRAPGDARGALGADDRLGLHAFYLFGRALYEANLLFRRRDVLARRQARVKAAQAAPRAQMLFVVARAKRARVFDC